MVKLVFIALLLVVSCKNNEQQKNEPVVAPIENKGGAELKEFNVFGYGVGKAQYVNIAKQQAIQVARASSIVSDFTYSPGGTIVIRNNNDILITAQNSQETQLGEKAFFRVMESQAAMDSKIYNALPSNPDKPMYKGNISFDLAHVLSISEVYSKVIQAYIQTISGTDREVQASIFISNISMNDSLSVDLEVSIY